MWRRRIAASMLGSLLAAGALCLVLWSFGSFEAGADYRPVPPGHQEIAFMAPATMTEAWERLVDAVDALAAKADGAAAGAPRIHIDKRRAFVELTAEVPEIAVWVDGAENARLWIRWYKLTGEFNSEKRIGRLTERSPPPLAVIGGDTSPRAMKLASELQKHRHLWQGQTPLLLINGASIDRFIPHELPNQSTTDPSLPRLIDLYKDRTFRFGFNNEWMASVLLDFVRQHDELWPRAPLPATLAAGLTAPGHALSQVTAAAAFEHFYRSVLFDVKWDDDSYSVDLADRFQELFDKKLPLGLVSPYQIDYSVGDFYQPNPREAFVAGQILPELAQTRDRRQILLVPANAERIRRFLRTLARRSSPQDTKNLVVVAGPSMSFNTIYRDRDIAWNIQDLPLPLVLFFHRNPVDSEVGFKEPAQGLTAPSATGTEDLLLYRDILEAGASGIPWNRAHRVGGHAQPAAARAALAQRTRGAGKRCRAAALPSQSQP
jgi:hypothetical protein